MSGGAGDRRRAKLVRMVRYLEVLWRLRKVGASWATSELLSEQTTVNATEVRRDFAALGGLGRRGRGYDVDRAIDVLCRELRLADDHDIILVGAGRVGVAIIDTGLFDKLGLRVTAVFDNDPAKVGGKFGTVRVRPIEELTQATLPANVVFAVIAVPAASAQAIADQLVGAGVHVIFSYPQALLRTPPDVVVHYPWSLATVIALVAAADYGGG